MGLLTVTIMLSNQVMSAIALFRNETVYPALTNNSCGCNFISPFALDWMASASSLSCLWKLLGERR